MPSVRSPDPSGARLPRALHPPRRHLQQPADRRRREPASRSAYKDYRIEGPDRYKTMTLDAAEFIRRFLLHVLPKGFHRIRHYGLLAGGAKAERSPGRASCCPYPHRHGEGRRRRRRAIGTAANMPLLRLACTSSRPSKSAAHRGIGHHPHQTRPGSTPHDDRPKRTSCLARHALARRRRRWRRRRSPAATSAAPSPARIDSCPNGSLRPIGRHNNHRRSRCAITSGGKTSGHGRGMAYRRRCKLSQRLTIRLCILTLILVVSAENGCGRDQLPFVSLEFEQIKLPRRHLRG